MTQTIGCVWKKWVLWWGQVCTPQPKGKRTGFGCVMGKPLICVRTVQVQRVAHPPLEDDHANWSLSIIWSLSQIKEKAHKKQNLNTGVMLFIMPIYSFEKLSCKNPPDTRTTHPPQPLLSKSIKGMVLFFPTCSILHMPMLNLIIFLPVQLFSLSSSHQMTPRGIIFPDIQSELPVMKLFDIVSCHTGWN